MQIIHTITVCNNTLRNKYKIISTSGTTRKLKEILVDFFITN